MIQYAPLHWGEVKKVVVVAGGITVVGRGRTEDISGSGGGTGRTGKGGSGVGGGGGGDSGIGGSGGV